MKMIRTLLLALCLTAPAAQANESLLSANIVLNPAVVEQCLYTTIGGATALGGVILTVLGIKRTVCDEKKTKSGVVLSLSGIALVLAGIHIATGK